jgi:hypothetical protein
MTPLARRLFLAPTLAASIALPGCGIADPYTHDAPRSSTIASAARAGATTGTVTDPSEPPPSKPTTTAASGVAADPGYPGAPTARQALELYTRLYINWTAKTIGVRQRQLATISQGTARAEALQAAARYSRDPELMDSRVANTGSIVSIAPGNGPQRSAWVIVTSEHTSGQGDYAGLPASPHVTYAHVIHAPTGWVVSQWSPQS